MYIYIRKSILKQAEIYIYKVIIAGYHFLQCSKHYVLYILCLVEDVTSPGWFICDSSLWASQLTLIDNFIWCSLSFVSQSLMKFPCIHSPWIKLHFAQTVPVLLFWPFLMLFAFLSLLFSLSSPIYFPLNRVSLPLSSPCYLLVLCVTARSAYWTWSLFN